MSEVHPHRASVQSRISSNPSDDLSAIAIAGKKPRGCGAERTVIVLSRLKSMLARKHQREHTRGSLWIARIF